MQYGTVGIRQDEGESEGRDECGQAVQEVTISRQLCDSSLYHSLPTDRDMIT